MTKQTKANLPLVNPYVAILFAGIPLLLMAAVWLAIYVFVKVKLPDLTFLLK